jgi:hypothetical protein
MFFPLIDHNITCSHLRERLLAFVLHFLSLGGGSATSWRSYSLVKWCFLLLEGVTTRDWINVLHDLVSVFLQSFLNE